MAGETSGLVIFSPRSVYEEIHGPAGSRIWRPGYLAALVEKHIPVWVITPISHAAGSIPEHEIVLCNPDVEGPLELHLMPFMASIFCPSNVELRRQAEKEGLFHGKDDHWWINYKSDKSFEIDEEGFQDSVEKYPSGRLLELSVKLIADNCRITSIYQPYSTLNQNGVNWMRSNGIDVDNFVYKPAGSEN